MACQPPQLGKAVAKHIKTLWGHTSMRTQKSRKFAIQWFRNAQDENDQIVKYENHIVHLGIDAWNPQTLGLIIVTVICFPSQLLVYHRMHAYLLFFSGCQIRHP